MGDVPVEAGKVEDVVAHVSAVATPNAPLDLWISSNMTLQDEPVSHGIAMAVVGDAVLGAGLTFDGFTEGIGGRTYHFKPW